MAAYAILTGMNATESKLRWFSATPGWLVLGLLAVEGLLWLSERFQWFGFNLHKGWTVLIAVAVAVFLLAVLIWFMAVRRTTLRSRNNRVKSLYNRPD